MVNVLPDSEQKRLAWRYRARLASAALFIVAFACAAGLLFLIPSYFLALEQVDASERYRAAVAGTVDLREGDAVERTSASTVERIQLALDFDAAARTSAVVAKLVETPRTGVALYSIAMTRREKGVVVTVGGEARTRADLLAFAEALRASGAFTDVALPVSQLVLERDVPFSLQVGLTKE